MILATVAALAIGYSATAFAQKADGTTLAGGDNGAKAKATESGKSSMPSTGMSKDSMPMKGGASTSSQTTPGPTNPKPGQ